MTDIAPPRKVHALQAVLAEMPQVREGVEVETTHFRADGMYARVVARIEGVCLVGKVHKREHFYCVTKGRVAVTNGDEDPVIYDAGAVLVSRPGTKRAVLALEASICMTVHRTDLTDLDEIERELIEPDETALFDARNQLKPKELT